MAVRFRFLGIGQACAAAAAVCVAAAFVTTACADPTTHDAGRFGGWEVACRAADSTVRTGASSCMATQRLAPAASRDPVFAMTIARGDTVPRGYFGVISVPLGGYLAPGLEMRVDKGPPYKILFETCNPAGCHAGFPISRGLLASMRHGRSIKVRLWTGKTSPVDVAVTLDGLGDALAAIEARA